MNKKPQPRIALVAGASGIVGRQLVKTLLRHRWEVIGLSRHASPHPDEHSPSSTSIYSMRGTGAETAIAQRDHPHFYSAWVNAANWTEMVEPNVAMLRHLVSNIEKTSPLRTVSLMQGYKVYGAHLGPFKTPARESDPGVPGAEFNAAQLHGSASSSAEKLALECAQAWRGRQYDARQCHESRAEHRALRLAVSGAEFTAALPRFGKQTWHSIVDHTDGGLLADATLWAATRRRRKIRRSTSITAISGAGASCGRASPTGLNCPPRRRSGSLHQLFVDYRAVARTGRADPVEADILRLNDGTFADFVFSWNLRHVWRCIANYAGRASRKCRPPTTCFSACSLS